MAPRIRLTVAAALFLCWIAFLPAQVSAQSRAPAKTPYRAENDHIEVLFASDSQVRLRGGGLVDLSTNALDGVDRALAGVARYEWSRICDVPEQQLDDIAARGKANTGQEIYNLNNIYRLRIENAAGSVDIWKLSEDLEALPGILTARPVPLPVEAPLPPNYQPSQNYEDPAASNPTGVDAEYAWTQLGGNGMGVSVCDLEYSWNYNHNDVTAALGSQINTNVADPFSDNNHGTAVIGEMVSNNNGWGTKGICYASGLKTCGTYYGTPSPSWNVPGAMAVAIANLSQGDIILLEQQWDYTGSSGYVPIEWWLNYSPGPQSFNGVYAAIVNAVASGIHVVEAGGNGNINTGGLTWFGDSGAIIVGAGGAYAGGTWAAGNLERLSFSSYGPRFDLQGWGENVYSTGYGNLYSAEGVNRWYTNNFSGTSSASPIVAGAVACVQGYYLANISAVPLSPGAMRALLVSTGTPQAFGPSGNIGPRPNCFAAIQAVTPAQFAEYGDAPENALAYPGLGVIGQFPTCVAAGPPGSFVRHLIPGGISAFFGPGLDFESEGNSGFCGAFPPYDADECQYDADSGLLAPTAFTIDATLNVTLCNPGPISSFGMTCSTVGWGPNLDIQVNNSTPQAMYVNVLMDWNQDGRWTGSSSCGFTSAPEHALVNFVVPPGYIGPLSSLGPPAILLGPNAGFVWSRFTISESPVVQGWNGTGSFNNGETCDYLLRVDGGGQTQAEFGDAPEGAVAYPWLGVLGQFPTCIGTGPSGFVRHFVVGSMFFGPSVDIEFEGNAGNCPNFPPYDADECWNDGDAGLITPPPYTIDPNLNIVPCDPAYAGSLGLTCNQAAWGPNVDIFVNNPSPSNAYVNVLMDWDQNGVWGGASPCPAGAAPEHVLQNFLVPPGFAGPLSALAPPGFLIGPKDPFVWCRFTISETGVPIDWDGSALFSEGETCDYLLRVDPQPQQSFEFGDAPENSLAYPWSGVMGQFPTCVATGPAGFVSHVPSGLLYFGPNLDFETEGNAGNCPNFPPYDADECQNDGDAGLLLPIAFTIDAALNPVACPFATGPAALGPACSFATWGPSVDIHVVNNSASLAFVNVLIDWDQNGSWGGSAPCPQGAVPENVLFNFVVPAGFIGPLSALGPPGFLIGPNDRFVWCRFTISDAPVPIAWDGSGTFQAGETCDYLLAVEPGVTGVDDRSEAITATRLLPAAPNPFGGTTTIRFEMASAGQVTAGVYDIAGRRIRVLLDGERSAGRYDVVWNGRNDEGRQVAAGIYFLRMRTGGKTFSSPLIMTR